MTKFSFNWFYQVWKYKSATASDSTVSTSFIAVEPGMHYLSDGARYEAGKVDCQYAG